VTYASSTYQQRARLFPSDTKVIYFPYGKNIGRYLKVFSQKSINLFRFEDACKYPKGPVCFLLNKIGLKDGVIDRMQIHSNNESMSDMAVDLLTYINREIPYTEANIKNGLRKRFDCKHLISLPGRKYQLLEQDVDKLRDKTKSNMIWLKENFNISYSVKHKSPNNIYLEFDDTYVEIMIVVLRKLSPIIKKLIYDYIHSRITEVSLDVKSRNNLLILESHFKQKYFLITKLSYSQLAYPQKIIVVAYNLLKRSRKFRRLKHRWIDKPLPVNQME